MSLPRTLHKASKCIVCRPPAYQIDSIDRGILTSISPNTSSYIVKILDILRQKQN